MSKTKKGIWITLMIIPSLIITLTAVLKLLRVDQVVNEMTQIGFGDYITFLALGELLFTGLFLLPKTYKLGFLLLTCYLSGAIAIEISKGQFPGMAVLLTLIWISVLLRDKFMFLTSDNTTNQS